MATPEKCSWHKLLDTESCSTSLLRHGIVHSKLVARCSYQRQLKYAELLALLEERDAKASDLESIDNRITELRRELWEADRGHA